MQIVPVEEDDIADLVRLARDIWYQHYPSIITVEQIEYMLDQRYHPDVIRAQIASESAWWDKLVLERAMIAFTSYERGDRLGEMKLDKLYVRYDLRGRGYGSLLLRHVEERTRMLGCQRLYLQVNKNNLSAIEAYRHNGFQVAHAARFDIGNGYYMDDYVMAKDIGGKETAARRE